MLLLLLLFFFLSYSIFEHKIQRKNEEETMRVLPFPLEISNSNNFFATTTKTIKVYASINENIFSENVKNKTDSCSFFDSKTFKELSNALSQIPKLKKLYNINNKNYQYYLNCYCNNKKKNKQKN